LSSGGQSLQKVSASPITQTTVGVLNAFGDVAAKTVPGTAGKVFGLFDTANTSATLAQGWKQGTTADTLTQMAITGWAETKGLQMGAQAAFEAGSAQGLLVGPTVARTALAYGDAAGLTAVVSYEVGKYAIAPYVAPWLSTVMFNTDQKYFGGAVFEPGK